MDFNQKKHARYFLRLLNVLPSHASNYDSTRLLVCFFAVSGLDLLDELDQLTPEKKDHIREWVYHLLVQAKNSDGEDVVARSGFQGASTLILPPATGTVCHSVPYACGHVSMTYTGLGTLLILGDDLSRINRKVVAAGVRACQQPDGSFCATLAGSECDMRFVYSAAAVCYILKDWSGMDKGLATDYILQSLSYDNAFAQGPGLESHGGHTFCAVASLSLMGTLHTMLSTKQLDRLRRWCIMRQESGFNGRPNKPVDTCYSFWVGATLKILDCYDLINKSENRNFTLATQDNITGGFAKWISTDVEPLHTYFALAGLSLLKEPGLIQIHPELNLSQRAVEHLHKLHLQWACN
ncbi:Geranylgeranyl transferase type-1 subunit beta [Frankliniella fusca]|uniref:Geranylgeranyl transferase type-1 subunit beta n=1 Tax=Frankliniella fusca TaxID=407009 RepID=A0AAE1HT61_9NEOP|nr:Geranylgeranyl transferase type-1 subunit beta [Frankliniella fusca]